MKFLSSNTRFSIAIAQSFVFVALFFSVNYDVFFKQFSSPSLKYMSYGGLAFNYFALKVLWKIYVSLKIHPLKKMCSYSELLKLLKIQRSKPIVEFEACAELEQENMDTCERERFLQKHLGTYVWFRNSNSQKALYLCLVGYLMFKIVLWVHAPMYLLLLAGGLLFAGFIKIISGYTEVA